MPHGLRASTSRFLVTCLMKEGGQCDEECTARLPEQDLLVARAGSWPSGSGRGASKVPPALASLCTWLLLHPWQPVFQEEAWG